MCSLGSHVFTWSKKEKLRKEAVDIGKFSGEKASHYKGDRGGVRVDWESRRWSD